MDRKRNNDYQETGSYRKYLYGSTDGKSLIRYTIDCDEYIAAIDMIYWTGEFRSWDETDGYHTNASSRPWCRANGVSLDLMGYSVVLADGSLSTRADGIFNLTHAVQPKMVKVVGYPYLSQSEFNENELVDAINSGTFLSLFPYNRILYPNGIELVPNVDGNLDTDLAFNLNLMAQMGYWNYGTKHMINYDYAYNNGLKASYLKVLECLHVSTFVMNNVDKADYEFTIGIDGAILDLTLRGKPVRFSQDLSKVYYDGGDMQDEDLDFIYDRLTFCSKVGIEGSASIIVQ